MNQTWIYSCKGVSFGRGNIFHWPLSSQREFWPKVHQYSSITAHRLPQPDQAKWRTKKPFWPGSQTFLIWTLCDRLICYSKSRVCSLQEHTSIRDSEWCFRVGADVTKSRLCQIFQQLALCVLSLGTRLCWRAVSSSLFWTFNLQESQGKMPVLPVLVYIVQLGKMQGLLIVHLLLCLCSVKCTF